MERVSITYVGVAVCADAQLAESDADGARIATQQPMPVGTELEVSIGDTVHRARVTSVSEVRDAGMRLAFVEAGGTMPAQEAAPPASAAAERSAEAQSANPGAAEPPGPVEPEAKPKRKKKKSE